MEDTLCLLKYKEQAAYGNCEIWGQQFDREASHLNQYNPQTSKYPERMKNNILIPVFKKGQE